MKSRQVLLVFCILILTIQVSGQRVLFSYDAAGNRIRRAVEETPTEIQCNSPLPGSSAQNQNDSAKSTGLKDFSLNVFPNPTDGRLTITSKPSPDISTGFDITLYSASGVIIKRLTSMESKINVDLSDQEPGVYLLLVSSDDSSSRIKILLY